MSYGFEHTPARINWTYSSEEAQWHADNPSGDWGIIELSKTEYLSIVKKDFEREFAYYKDYLDGKIELPKKYPAWMYLEEKLFYIAYPDKFNKDIKMIESGWGELSVADQAWINNTGKLVKKYNSVFEKMKVR